MAWWGGSYAGLNIGDAIAGNTPGTTSGNAIYGPPAPKHENPIIAGLHNLTGHLIDGADWLTTLDDKAKRAVVDAGNYVQNRPKPKKRKPQPDPYADMMRQVMAGAGAAQGTRMSRKEQEKAINAAILAARAPYDQAISEARGGLKDALSINKRLTTGLDANTGGTSSRNEAYKQQVDAKTQEQVARAMADNDMSKFGGVGGGGDAATRAQQAADARIGSTTAQAAAVKKGSDQQAVEAGAVAGGIGDFIKGEEAQTRGDLMKQAQKQVQRLQKERAAAIAMARAQARAGITESNASGAQAAAQAYQANVDNMLKIMGMRSEDNYRQQSLQLQREKARQAALQGSQTNPLDALKILIGASTAQVRTPSGQVNNNGTPIYGYGAAYSPEQINALAGALGLPGNPFAVAPAGKQQDMGGMLGGWIKGLFR